MTVEELNSKLGNIDIYLLDQILKGRFDKGMKILDAGCGEGRNLIYFMRECFTVYGIDENPLAIKYLQTLARSINKSIPEENFITGDLRDIQFPDEYFDVVLSSAVLHFSEGKSDFQKMFSELMRVLKQGGILFLRMCTEVGMNNMEHVSEGTYKLPDGTIRYILTEETLGFLIKKYSLRYLEPFKSVVVHGQRSMATLVLEKAQKPGN